MQETKLRLGREGVSGPESPRLHCYDQGAVNAIFAGGRFPVGVGQEFDRAAALGKPIVAKHRRSLRAAHPHLLAGGSAVGRGYDSGCAALVVSQQIVSGYSRHGISPLECLPAVKFGVR